MSQPQALEFYKWNESRPKLFRMTVRGVDGKGGWVRRTIEFSLDFADLEFRLQVMGSTMTKHRKSKRGPVIVYCMTETITPEEKPTL